MVILSVVISNVPAMTQAVQAYPYAGPSLLADGRLGLSTSGGTALSGPQTHPRFFSGLLTHAAPAAGGPARPWRTWPAPAITSRARPGWSRPGRHRQRGPAAVRVVLRLLRRLRPARRAAGRPRRRDARPRHHQRRRQQRRCGEALAARRRRGPAAPRRRPRRPDGHHAGRRGRGEEGAAARRAGCAASPRCRSSRPASTCAPSCTRPQAMRVPARRCPPPAPRGAVGGPGRPDAAPDRPGPVPRRGLPGRRRTGSPRCMPLLRFAKAPARLRPAGRRGPARASAWELELPGMRHTLTLSPEPCRGFSGEGAVLDALATDEAADDADAGRHAARLRARPSTSACSPTAPGCRPTGSAPRSPSSAPPAASATTCRGRPLPPGAALRHGTSVAQLNPRLAAARALVDVRRGPPRRRPGPGHHLRRRRRVRDRAGDPAPASGGSTTAAHAARANTCSPPGSPPA